MSEGGSFARLGDSTKGEDLNRECWIPSCNEGNCVMLRLWGGIYTEHRECVCVVIRATTCTFAKNFVSFITAQLENTDNKYVIIM